MTDVELTILRDATIGPERGSRAGEQVRVEFTAARVGNQDTGWRHVGEGSVRGWVDNLKEGTVMIYPSGRDVYALTFREIVQVSWGNGR